MDPAQRGVVHSERECDLALTEGFRMRVANIIRIGLLGTLIVAGIILYPEGQDQSPASASVTSLVPSPVTVTDLTGSSS